MSNPLLTSNTWKALLLVYCGLPAGQVPAQESPEDQVVSRERTGSAGADRIVSGDTVQIPLRTSHSVIANLFEAHSWYKPPPAPPPRLRSSFESRAPVAPPLPFEYLGRYEQVGEDTVFVLANDDRVYDVHLGDVIENTYSVDAVVNGQLMFTYLPLNQRQRLQLGELK